jgi:broad specificity phosphatase PhoE
VVDIVLVRHASTDLSGSRYCGASDPPLSDAGRADAARLAVTLAPGLAPDTRVLTSPLRRSADTAAAIADAAGLARIEVDDRWRETDFGLAEGRTYDELLVVAPGLAAALAGGELAIDWPGGEAFASLVDRVATAWHDLLADGRPAVVVTHAGPFLHARAIAGGRPIRAEDLVAPATAVRVSVPVDGPSAATVLTSRP